MWIVRSRLKVYKKKIHIPLDGTKDMMKVNWSNFHCDKVIPLIISELYDTEFITKLTMSFNQFITPFLYRHKFHLRAEKLNSTGKKKEVASLVPSQLRAIFIELLLFQDMHFAWILYIVGWLTEIGVENAIQARLRGEFLKFMKAW